MASAARNTLSSQLLTLLPDSGKVITPSDHRSANDKMLDYVDSFQPTPTSVPADYNGLVAPGFVARGDKRLVTTVESNNESIIQAVGTFLTDSSGIYSGGSALYTKDVNPILRVTYYGTGFTPVSQTAPGYAPYEVWEGTNKIATVSLTSDAPQIYHDLTPLVLSEGIHTLEFRFINPNGTATCLFDAVRLTTSAKPIVGANEVAQKGDWSGIPNPIDYAGSFSDRIEAAIADAVLSGGSRSIIVTEQGSVSRPVLVPGDFTLFIAGTIQRAAGAYNNIIRSANTADPSNIPQTPLRNIKVIGLGNGCIAGVTDGWGGDAPANVPGGQAWRSTALLFANVEQFEVSGLRFYDTNSWATCFEQCRYGKVTNLTFDQRNGSKNQDGIDIRDGSHDILVENISGGTYDDMLALTNLPGYAQNKILGTTIYEVDKRTNTLRTERNIYNIIARNFTRFFTADYGVLDNNAHHMWGGFLILGSSAQGCGIHDITIDGIAGVQQIYVAFDSATFNYTDGNPSTVDDIYNINISNTGQAGIRIIRPIKNCSFVNVARTDIFGQPAVVLPTGSLNITRKYQDGAPEFIATV